MLRKPDNALTIALVGNPNCGKSTVFNALTGGNQRVGNWPGVTVERKTGRFDFQDVPIQVVDLPGVYSLSASAAGNQALDEQIACHYILNSKPDLIINIIDAAHLERHLYLTSQLIDMQIPMIIALNMMDVAEMQGKSIDAKCLAKYIGCPVVPIQAKKMKGIEQLKRVIVQQAKQPQLIESKVRYPESVENAIVAGYNRYIELAKLENNRAVLDADILIADARYTWAHQLTRHVVCQSGTVRRNITQIIDHIVLNRVLGIPVFLFVIYLMFLLAINVGGAFQDFFDISTETLFVQGLAQLLTHWHWPAWAVALLANGMGKGLNTTITFIPVIGAMFFCLAFLEESGYMARAAFVMDRLMRAMGLPGKSFVPMIIGFGCNVPAVMSARTLESERDRILTILMSPFMSCSARLAIFAVFAAAFFPRGGQNIVFALYLIGIFIAVLTGFVLRKSILKGASTPFIMEMPVYHLPTGRALFYSTWLRLKQFIVRAGRYIVPICILIGALNALTIHGTLHFANTDQNSLLAVFARFLTPLFAPMGIQQSNWPATVGLLTGVLAKEIVIATLNTLYTQVGHLTTAATQFNVWAGLHAAVISIPDNLKALPQALGNPIMASAPEHDVTQGVYGVMYQLFGGQTAAFSYLLFILLYIPCVSTAAAIAKELNKGWALFSLFWSLGIAYGAAVLFYQGATVLSHPLSSLISMMSIVIVFLATIFVMKYKVRLERAG